jgi:hypothetical protein
MIAYGPTLPEGAVALLRECDPLVRRYRAFFALLDWALVPGRDPTRPWPGRVPHPAAAYVKALLVKVCEGFPYVTDLRAFLVEHPLLVLELGFRPVPDPAQPYGFAAARTVPCARYLRRQQEALAPTTLQALLRATVQALQEEIPGLGETVAVDVKHIYAWVQANNPKAYVRARHDPQRQPSGDPDCRLGAKASHNQLRADGTTASQTTWVWGYGSGVVAATDPVYGDVVLAEQTQPFNTDDGRYYHPLHRQAAATLGRPPTNVAADAAFDAWHIYETCVATGGIPAIPLNTRGHPAPQLGPHGHHLCPRGHEIVPTNPPNQHPDGYRAQTLACPLLRPTPTGQACDHAQFAKGVGCVKHINVEAGGRLRVTLDRASEAYRAVYRQRTAAERINSQATALGIERPKARRQRTVANLNTLIYLVINARALARARALNHAAPRLC